MPIRYQVKENGGLLHAVARGALSLEEIQSHFEDIENNPVLNREYRALVDLRAVEDLRMDLESIQALVLLQGAPCDESRLRPARLALLVRDPSIYLAARQYEDQVHDAGLRAQVFLDEREALIWLTY